MNILKPSKIKKSKSYVLYGRSGTGKTTLSASFPGKILLIDVRDDGIDSISDMDDKIDIVSTETWDDFELTYQYLKRKKKKYSTVVIDTVTQLQLLCLEHICNKTSVTNWGDVSRQQYGKASNMLQSWILKFRDLPLETVFTAQDRIFNTDNEEVDSEITPAVGPRLMPSVASFLCASCTLVGECFINHSEKKGAQYMLRVSPHSYYITKVRKPKSVELKDITNPSYKKIQKLFKLRS